MVDDKLHEHVAPLSDDLPLSVYTQSYRHAAREHIPLHWHSDVQLTWVYEGALDYTVEGGSLALTPDDLLLVNAGHLHGSRTVQGDTRTLCINFASEQLFPPALLRRYICPLLEDAAFSHAVLPLRAEWSEILRGCCAWEGEPLSAGQLASAAAVNRTMLSVLFKKYTGMTPTRYRNEYRLYMAKSMIVGTDRPITEICAETGYNQLSHFIEQFRLRYGASPLQYRKRYGAG